MKKKKCRCGRPIACDLSTIKEEVHAMHQDIQCFFQLDKHTKIPTPLYHKLCDTFKCNICRNSPIIPPVIFARCCKSIVGCQTCVDTWYRGDSGITKKCPLCGTDRALPETIRLHGLDDFLEALQPLLNESEERTADDAGVSN